MASNRRRWKSWALEEGVGLRIALDKPTTGHATPTNTVVSSFHLRRISPRPPATSVGSNTLCRSADVGSSGKGVTAVSHLGSRLPCVSLSPSRPRGRTTSFPDETSHFKVAGFLRSCHLCRKNLDGKDIYMYRGEKAFCSAECRYQQMRNDEKPESHCAAVASRPSVGTGGRLFYHGVEASA